MITKLFNLFLSLFSSKKSVSTPSPVKKEPNSTMSPNSVISTPSPVKKEPSSPSPLFNQNQIKLILLNNPDYQEWFTLLQNTLPLFQINTLPRIAAFLAQTCHESNYFKSLSENLNYSQLGLIKTFPKYFDDFHAKLYARHPQKIANKVYSNRLGNSDEKSGDGWSFRGRGLIQLTGKSNYQAFASYIDKSLDDTVSFLETKQGALSSACYFWQNHNLNLLADKKDITSITRKINGGTNGLSDRLNKYNKFYSILSSSI